MEALTVNFMGTVFTGNIRSLQQYGTAIGLPNVALDLFVGLRTWSTTLPKDGNPMIALRRSEEKNTKVNPGCTRNNQSYRIYRSIGNGNHADH